ncbi:flagellar hook-basal body complex protein FliE [Comamonas sp.]
MKIDTSNFLMRSPSALGELGIAQPQPAITPSMYASPSTSGFLSVFESAVLDVDARTRAASDRVAAVDAGHSDDMVGAMLASQEASLSFSMLMQVRNKVMGAVDEIVKLQV